MKTTGFFVLLGLSLFFFFSDVASKDGGQFDCKEFMDDGMYCTRESNPHCGTDGMTYGNKCSFCKAVKRSQGSVRLEHLGKC
ncbi:serine protease inhibitor Kazal-type 6-like isoform X6 [Chrysemys picta bellii]|uniref:serine protease inhibitor Kazal-type 6-like isoform X6 n=1 Tax=Chrysemys picta bellii TaxID=8478 RepID=UPI0032B20F5E